MSGGNVTRLYTTAKDLVKDAVDYADDGDTVMVIVMKKDTFTPIMFATPIDASRCLVAQHHILRLADAILEGRIQRAPAPEKT